MKLPSLRIRPALKPWLLAALAAVPLTSACGDDEAAPTPPATFSLAIVDLDSGDGEVARPRCDGTLAVTVAITPASRFTLQPPHACGSSGACGFVRTEALASDGTRLATAESVTTTTVLQLDPARLPELATVRASLVRGVDGELVKNPDRAEVTTEVEPIVSLPTDCEMPGGGGAGGQGAGGQGAGGQGAGGQSAGGQGGAAAELGGADAGGASGLAGAGGDSGGAPVQGGAAGESS